MVVVPKANPVTTPDALIVATAGLDDTQGLTAAGVPLPVKVVVPGVG